MKRAHGFTLVEMIIIIVVIAVLAAIGYASYVGVTRNAENTKILNMLNTTVKGLQLYKTRTNQVPRAGLTTRDGQNEVCIGYEDNYPAVPGTAHSGAGECGYSNIGGSGETVKIAPGFMKEVAPYIGDRPSFRSNYIWFEQRRGIRFLFYKAPGVDGKMSQFRIDYIMAGDIDCPDGEKKGVFNGNTRCEIKLNDEFEPIN